MGAHQQRLASDQAAWNAARRLPKFSYAALAAEAGVPIERATRLTRGWVRVGVVEELGRVGSNKLIFRVCRDVETPPQSRPDQSAEGNMWRTMRALRAAFTPTDIAAHATTEAVRASTADAQAYCQMLVRAGYLKVARKAVPNRREAVYRLVKDTGPKPPRERRLRVVWDDNLAEVTHLPVAGSGGEA
ncbi:hypothetical protein [Pararhodobacter zhoushanensis]|uniref:Uncharacterized protein n=1 Tax=Pararhodobacter zhoushanensis TaxID=2479545 RepID=A0ABT3H2V2_9RHOB|nr:hypothetical protein [Pararhodobacter zhoushanensis]MCW1934096.1 hypothetical protein [Pararhodobacter zhoushanensis]